MDNTTVRPTEAKRISWQQFGKNFDRPVTIDEAIELAGLDYEVDTAPLLRVSKDVIDGIMRGEKVDFVPTRKDIIDSHKVTYRTDTGDNFGVVGKNYGLVANSKAFEFINFIKEVSGEEPLIETAGSLGYGERMFVTCRLGADSYLNGDRDAIKNYVLFTNTFDGSGAVMALFTKVRVICQNTLNIAIQGCPNKIIFKHTKNVNARLDWEVEENRRRALETFSRSVKFSKVFIDRMMLLKSQNVTSDMVRDLTAKMYLTPQQFNLFTDNNFKLDGIDEISTRTKNQIFQLRDSVDFGVGQEEHRGTKLWLLNGITTMLHNEKKWKTSQDEFNSLIDGDGAKKVQKMYNLLLAA